MKERKKKNKQREQGRKKERGKVDVERMKGGWINAEGRERKNEIKKKERKKLLNKAKIREQKKRKKERAKERKKERKKERNKERKKEKKNGWEVSWKRHFSLVILTHCGCVPSRILFIQSINRSGVPIADCLSKRCKQEKDMGSIQCYYLVVIAVKTPGVPCGNSYTDVATMPLHARCRITLF